MNQARACFNQPPSMSNPYLGLLNNGLDGNRGHIRETSTSISAVKVSYWDCEDVLETNAVDEFLEGEISCCINVLSEGQANLPC